VVWADGAIDAKERAAILKAAEERDMHAGTPSHELLKTWLETQPADSIVEAWKTYIDNVWPQLERHEREAMRLRLLDLARGVAEAAGGFLGLGSKISAAERAILDEIDAALR
jgi:hypothetical protein